VLASRYGAVGMAWATLIGVVVMEGMLLLPLVYRRLGDSWPRRALRALRILGLPAAVTAGLAWAAGRGGGPLYSFTDGHTRLVGFVGVVVTGAALMVVFYAFLLVSMPADERQLFLGRLRDVLDRVRTRLH
jgi:hypothetical protein